MLVNADGPVVGFGEGLVVVGGPDVRLVVVLFACEAQVDYQLLCTSDPQVGVDESDVLFGHWNVVYGKIDQVRKLKKIVFGRFYIINKK
jgi:hypothetical protein